MVGILLFNSNIGNKIFILKLFVWFFKLWKFFIMISFLEDPNVQSFCFDRIFSQDFFRFLYDDYKHSILPVHSYLSRTWAKKKKKKKRQKKTNKTKLLQYVILNMKVANRKSRFQTLTCVLSTAAYVREFKR